jgi:hypothetical protein
MDPVAESCAEIVPNRLTMKMVIMNEQLARVENIEAS